jgi:uncharacterized protein
VRLPDLVGERPAGPGALLWAAGIPVRALLLALLLLYRSSLSRVMGQRCRFHPSCSAYAQEAIRVHGAAKGLVLGLWRLLRCSPLTAGGFDPVPVRGTARHGPRRARSYDVVTHRKGP